MKLITKSFNDDYYQRDVGIGFRGRKNQKKPSDNRLKRGLKRMLNKARRVEGKNITCDTR